MMSIKSIKVKLQKTLPRMRFAEFDQYLDQKMLQLEI